MSKCNPENKDFMNGIEIAIKKAFPSCRDIKVFYDAHPTYAKRDYVLEATVSDDWRGDDTLYLKEVLRQNGAANVIGCKRKAISRSYVDVAFDEQVKK